jgi:hypothetical protein
MNMFTVQMLETPMECKMLKSYINI